MSTDPADLDSWLEAHGLMRYAPLFRQHEIDLDVLPELSADDLRELGIPLGDRKRLLNAIPGLTPAEATRAIPGATGPAAAAERRRMTIAFCDIVGSTRLAGRLDPEELGDVMRNFQRTCLDVVGRWDGYVSKFLGDGAVILFGWPRAHEYDAERAVHAVLELVDAVSRIPAGAGERLQARAGIATGLVVVGDVGSEGAGQRTDVVGETPNLAARIQEVAAPGTVIIAAETRRLIGDRFVLESLGSRALKGVAGPVELMRVLGVAETRSRFETRGGTAVSEIVGRDAELDMLRRAWRESSRGTGRGVLIHGEPGIGKSRLLKALLDEAAADSGARLRLQCSPYHTSTPLHPFIEWIRSAAGLQIAHNGPERIRRLEAFLADLGVTAEPALPLLAVALVIPLEGSAYRPPASSPQIQRERTLDLLAQLVDVICSDRPLVLAIEDLHWADPTTLEVLERVLEVLPAKRILVVGTARPEFALSFGGDRVHRLGLERLDTAAVAEMARQLTGGVAPSDAALAFIARSADGTPLFIEEVTRALVESGRLHDVSTGAGDPVAFEETVPATLHDLLAARLDNLHRGHDVARVAAVAGRSFSRAIISRLLPARTDELDGDLEYLCGAGIFDCRKARDADEIAYAFRHALVRDAAYQSQLKSDRRLAHARVASVIEAHFPELAETEPELMAYHHERAGQPLEASRHLLLAGQRSLQVAATHEAITQLSRGCRILAELPAAEARDRSEMRLQAALGTAYMMARSWAAEEVARAYERAAALSHSAETTSERIWVLWGAWVYHQVRGRLDEAWEASRRINELADDSRNDEALVVASMISLQAHTYTGRFDGARTACRAFATTYDPERHGYLTALYSTDLDLVRQVHQAMVEWITGDFAAASALVESAAARAAGISHAYSSAWAPTWGALIPLLSGDYDDVATLVEQGVAVARENDYPYVIALGQLLGGAARGLAGDAEHGIREIAEALEAFRATGAEIVFPLFETLEAELLLRMGRLAEASATLDDAAARIEKWGECWQEAEVHRVRANVLSAGDASPADIEASFHRALRIARDQGALAWEIRAATDYAEWLVRQSRASDAADTARHVLRSVADLDVVADTRRAANLLASIDIGSTVDGRPG
jgi:class 3 adenylate cyclase/predicted ATPase